MRIAEAIFFIRKNITIILFLKIFRLLLELLDSLYMLIYNIGEMGLWKR